MTSSTIQNLNRDSPRKDIFVLHFLQALSKLRSQKSFISPKKISKRARKIKIAAYVSMARAARGTNLTWRNAILWKYHRGTQVSKIVGYTNPKKWSLGTDDFIRSRRVLQQRLRRKKRSAMVNRLRTVVPGGGDMETLKLMVETTHYINCLSMQVNVMQSIVDALSA